MDSRTVKNLVLAHENKIGNKTGGRLSLVFVLILLVIVGFVEGQTMTEDQTRLDAIEDASERARAELMLRGAQYE